MKIIADTHIHTKYSADSILKPQDLIDACKHMGINCIAVTDHDEIEGAFKMKEMAPFKVIVGEEIRTEDGEIIGLFLKERIPPRLSGEETIERIKGQGGLVYIPHPFSVFRKEAISRGKLFELYKKADIIECYNCRNFLSFENTRAVNFARQNNKIMGGGSDAHHRCEIGNLFIEMEDFNTKDEFMSSLSKGKIVMAPYSRRIGSFMIEASLFLSWIKMLNFFKGKKT